MSPTIGWWRRALDFLTTPRPSDTPTSLHWGMVGHAFNCSASPIASNCSKKPGGSCRHGSSNCAAFRLPSRA
eukprot:5009136-Alexandrium_andersonii.AAC.1